MFSDLMTPTLGKIKKRPNSSNIKSCPNGAIIPGDPTQTMGGKKLKRH